MHSRILFSIDTKEWGPDHSKQITQKDLKNISISDQKKCANKLSSNFIQSGASKAIQPGLNAEFDIKFEYIFIPLQVATDTMINTHSPISVVDFSTLVANWGE